MALDEDTAEAALDDLRGGYWNHDDAKYVLEVVQQTVEGMFTGEEMVKKIADRMHTTIYLTMDEYTKAANQD